jgi:hypothetical protein
MLKIIKFIFTSQVEILKSCSRVIKKICMISLRTSLEGPKKLKHAGLSWEHNMDMFLRYTADPGFPKRY